MTIQLSDGTYIGNFVQAIDTGSDIKFVLGYTAQTAVLYHVPDVDIERVREFLNRNAQSRISDKSSIESAAPKEAVMVIYENELTHLDIEARQVDDEPVEFIVTASGDPIWGSRDLKLAIEYADTNGIIDDNVYIYTPDSKDSDSAYSA